MTDHSQAHEALLQGWRPIAWIRDFDAIRCTIMVQPDGRCIWRAQRLDDSRTVHTGQCDDLAEAHETISRIVRANPLIISGAPSVIR